MDFVNKEMAFVFEKTRRAKVVSYVVVNREMVIFDGEQHSAVLLPWHKR